MKKTLTILITLGGLVAALVLVKNIRDTRNRAALSGLSLSFSESTKSAPVNSELSLGIILNTDVYEVTAAELHLAYDSSAIQILNFTRGTILSDTLPSSTPVLNRFSTILSTFTPYKGPAGILGTLKVKVLKATTSSITFIETPQVPATMVAGVGKTGNILVSTSGINIIGQGPTNTPAPTNTSIPVTRYACNTVLGTCSLSANGPYISLSSCQSGCIKPTNTPMPTNTIKPSPTNTTKPSPTNTTIPTNTPAPTNTSIPVTRYACNTVLGTCSLSANGPYISLSSCQSGCIKPTNTPMPTNTPAPTNTSIPVTRYACNTVLGTCSLSANGPYISLSSCQSGCIKPTNTPMPTNTIKPSPTNTTVPIATSTPAGKIGDISGGPDGQPDGKVDYLDYNFLVGELNKVGSPGFSRADLVRDGIVNYLDYNLLIGNLYK